MNSTIPPISVTDVNISWNSMINSCSFLAFPALRVVLVMYTTSCSCSQDHQVPGVWGSKLSTDAQNGVFSQHLVSVGHIQDTDRYLPSSLNQDPGCVQFFSVGGLWTWFHNAVYHLQGTIQPSSHTGTTLSHWADNTSLLESVKRDDSGRALGCHNNASSWPSYSMWCFKSTAMF
jgi:hypothetical protein